MTTGFDLLGDSRVLRVHWLKRTGAYLIDCLVVLLPTWVAFQLLGIGGTTVLGLSSGLVFLLYSTIAEAMTGRTLGKAAAGLRVRAVNGNLTPAKALVRSVPKFFWYLFPAIDAVAGMASEGDPRQRLSDRILGTTVVQVSYLKTRVHRIDQSKQAKSPPAKA